MMTSLSKTLGVLNEMHFKKKSERRRELAALPFAKKIEIVEQLRELGRATKDFRARAGSIAPTRRITPAPSQR